MPDEGLGGLVGMEYTNRGTSQTVERSIQTGPQKSGQEGNGASTPAPPPPPAPVSAEPPPKAPEPASDLIADLAKQFSQTVGEVPAPPPPETSVIEQKPLSEPPQTPPPVERTWRDESPPESLTKAAKVNWAAFKSKAIADVEKGESRIKELEKEVGSLKDQAAQLQPQLDQARRELADASGVVERVSIERSPLFKAKILDAESLLKSRLAKLLEGTGVNAQQAATLLGGSINQRENVLESSTITTFRRQQLADLINKWDAVQEERERMTSRGKETLAAYVKEQQDAEQARRAEFMRQSAVIFENQMALCSPKLEPYCEMPGNEDWNTHSKQLKAQARQIYDGNVSRETLAQVAILAPAAYTFQKLLQLAQNRILELQAQVARLQGVSPNVRDTGGDGAAPGTVPGLSSPSGDFVKDLVAKFQKGTGLS